MRCTILKIFVLLSFVSVVTHSQNLRAANSDSTTATHQRTVFSDLALIVDHGAAYVDNLGSVNHTQLLTVGAILGVSGALFAVDKPIQSLALRNHSSFNDNLSQYAEQYGGAGTGLIISGSVYITGILFGDTEIRKTGIMMFETLMWSGIVTNVFKSAFGRSRPYMNEGNVEFRVFQFKAGTTSLPSGHTTVAFALSSVLSERLHNTAASVGLYSLASLTALARVYHNVHWFSDTFLGAAIGTVAGVAIADFNENGSPHSSAQVRLMPERISLVLSF